jgi:hypothetical protein
VTLTAICYGRPNLKPYQRDCQYFNLAALLIRLRGRRVAGDDLGRALTHPTIDSLKRSGASRRARRPAHWLTGV